MSVPTNNPVAYTYTSPDSKSTGSTAKSIAHPAPISKVVHTIAGIRTTVYGLAELSPDTKEVTVLWLLHPRLQTESCMAPFASHLITTWNKHKQTTSPSSSRGLLAASFDQRNHGTREVTPIANEAWRSGNETHAQDMFSCYAGSAQDTSLLIDYLSSYIFPDSAAGSKHPSVTGHMVMGISLGGHAAWHVVMHDPRVTAAIVVIGSPDYVRLMTDRARLSKRSAYTAANPPGSGFVGSKDFPTGLVDAVKRYDPTGLLWGGTLEKDSAPKGVPGDEEKAKLLPVMTRCFGNKRILNLAGGADKLVPYAMGKPFLNWLGNAVGKGGAYEEVGLYFEDVVVPGVGHEVPPEMVRHMEGFVVDTLSEMDGVKKLKRDSRI